MNKNKKIKKTIKQNENSLYEIVGLSFLMCGIGWFVLSIIPITCGSPIKECLWMWIFGMVQIILGIILTLLDRKSLKFQAWALKDFQKMMERDLKKRKK